MQSPTALRRRHLIQGTAVASAWSVLGVPLSFFNIASAVEGDIVVPFLDAQPINPQRPMIQWDQLQDWVTPPEQFFSVSHYGTPAPIDPAQFQLEITGLVDKPMSLNLADIKSRPAVEHTATLECSGNGASPAFMGAVGNAKWKGTPLAPLLKEAGIKPQAKEVVFFGRDEGKEKIREQEFVQRFARSLSVEDANSLPVILAYEMNDQPLAQGHGFPIRLVIPGWYGIAWVKWLNRIEVLDLRFMGRYMARDYVTIRGEQQGDQTIWRETSVTRMNIKSLVARVVRRADSTVQVFGAAWTDGTPLKRVEIKIDNGPWVDAQLHEPRSPYAWTFWSYDWKNAPAGEHTLVSRATDTAGRIQPTSDDPVIALKKTYYEANQQIVRRIAL